MNEQFLIQKILKGDTESFRFLYRLHSLSAWQLAISVCRHKENAEEVVQNSFISAFRYLKNFRNESSFKTWLLKIVFNEAVKIQKAENKYQWQDITNDENDEGNTTEYSSSSLQQKETREQVARALAQMSEKESIVLNLFYLDELSIKEMAVVLGSTEGNVKVLLHRARKNFKNIYEKNYLTV